MSQEEQQQPWVIIQDGEAASGRSARATAASAAGRRCALADLVCVRHLDRRRCLAADAARDLRRGADVVVMCIPPPSAAKRSRGGGGSSGGDGSGGGDNTSRAAAAATAAAPADADADAAAVASAQEEVAARLLAGLQAAGVPAARDAGGRGQTPGARFHAWEAAGAPVRAEVGARETAARAATLALHPALAAAGGAALLERLRADAPDVARLLPEELAAAGTAPRGRALRLQPVAVEAAPAACRALLDAAAVTAVGLLGAPGGGSDDGATKPRLLPNGHCPKLHLWPDEAPAPCPVRLRHLLRLGPPCHCRVRHHVGVEELRAEAEARLQARGEAAAGWEGLTEPAPPATATLFVRGLPRGGAPGALQQRLAAALALHGCAAARVQVARGVRGGARGWARVFVDETRAEAAIAALDGARLVGG